ncbi:MAG: carbamoyl phosphate synthase small subunit [Ruminococcaceae bacterium]|nr:carbamoyl phosphate synthase small subunit [Oscillospiraceae bacterium]
MSKAYLVLENGKVFEGQSFGAVGSVTAEVVFTTGMVGYLETLTDKSFEGQIVCQTFPLIGNYGVISDSFEGDSIGPRGYIVKDLCQVPSNFRSEGELDTFFKARGVVGLCKIDTRALTKTLREEGIMNGVITNDPASVDFEALKAYKVANAVEVTKAKEITRFNEGGKIKVCLLDFGAKKSLIKNLASYDAEVIICPPEIKAEEITKLGADCIVLSDGPGDPSELKEAIENVKEIIKLGLPIMGICLGHQLLALAHGFKTYKLKYGHRGANQPVKYSVTGRVMITNQNHGYAVCPDSVDASVAELAFTNVNDKTNEGLIYKNIKALTVQFNPVVCDGPADTSFVYADFFKMLEK